MLYATEKVLALEAEMYEDVRKRVQQRLPVIEKTAAAVAELDVLASLADVAVQNRYVRPEVTISGKIHIIGGRHPVVEKLSAESGLAGKKEKHLVYSQRYPAGWRLQPDCNYHRTEYGR